MKSFFLVFFSVVLTVISIGTLALNIHALTTPLLIFVSACMIGAIGLAIPADLQKILVIVSPYLPDALVGGRRKTDPPAGGTP